MINPKQIESQKELTRVWVTALEETARDFFPRPRDFCVRAYEHAANNWMDIMTKEYGLKISPTNSIKESVEAYISLGVTGGLFEDASQFVLKEVNPNRLEITVLKCNYLSCCEDILKEGYSIGDLTCARIGCFAGAVRILGNIDCMHQVTSFKPNKCCQGFIERI